MGELTLSTLTQLHTRDRKRGDQLADAQEGQEGAHFPPSGTAGEGEEEKFLVASGGGPRGDPPLSEPDQSLERPPMERRRCVIPIRKEVHSIRTQTIRAEDVFLPQPLTLQKRKLRFGEVQSGAPLPPRSASFISGDLQMKDERQPDMPVKSKTRGPHTTWILIPASPPATCGTPGKVRVRRVPLFLHP